MSNAHTKFGWISPKGLGGDSITDEWTEAITISPLLKKRWDNYRPVTLLNFEDKVFERLVFKYLYNHLIDNNILTSLQYGFMPVDSTVNQLTYLYNTICQALDQGKEVCAVCLFV